MWRSSERVNCPIEAADFAAKLLPGFWNGTQLDEYVNFPGLSGMSLPCHSLMKLSLALASHTIQSRDQGCEPEGMVRLISSEMASAMELTSYRDSETSSLTSKLIRRSRGPYRGAPWLNKTRAIGLAKSVVSHEVMSWVIS